MFLQENDRERKRKAWHTRLHVPILTIWWYQTGPDEIWPAPFSHLTPCQASKRSDGVTFASDSTSQPHTVTVSTLFEDAVVKAAGYSSAPNFYTELEQMEATGKRLKGRLQTKQHIEETFHKMWSWSPHFVRLTTDRVLSVQRGVKSQCEFWGFICGVLEVFALLEYCAALVSRRLPTLGDKALVQYSWA